MKEGRGWRRGRDSNPRYRKTGTTVFETVALIRSATSPGKFEYSIGALGFLTVVWAVETSLTPRNPLSYDVSTVNTVV